MAGSSWPRATKEAAEVDWEDLLVGVKRGEEEALEELRSLVEKGEVEREMGKSLVVPVLLSRLGAVEEEVVSGRAKILALLRLLVSQFEPNKERIIELGALSNIAQSLSHDIDEVGEAVDLLLSVADAPKFRQRIGRVPGFMKKLVCMLTPDDSRASHDSKKLLHLLSGNIQNVLLMAEAGYFPFVPPHLKEGSDMNKIVMASAIAKMDLPDQMKANLGEVAIGPLVQMFRNGKLEAKLSSLGALQNLATMSANVPLLIHHGIVNPLLQLLFSVTSVLVTLREPAAAILASVARSELILTHGDITQQLLPLLSLSNPSIQHHLLQALNRVASHAEFSKVGSRMGRGHAIQLILPLLASNCDGTRLAALNLLHTYSKFSAGDFAGKLGENHLKFLVDVISAPASMEEKVTAIGILGNIPVSDKTTTEILSRTNLLPTVVSLLSARVEASWEDDESEGLVEDVMDLLVRFTDPSEKKLQSVCVRLGVMPLLVKLLSCGSSAVWSRAACSLAQLSQNSLSLAKSRSRRWVMCVPSLAEEVCAVHRHRCTIQSTFCLVKADAIPPLVRILAGDERGADEGVLLALSTLVQDEVLQGGSRVIEKASGVEALLKVIRLGNSKTRERAVWMLERILRNDAFRQKHGENVAPLLTNLQQSGRSSTLSTLLARILVHIELLQTPTMSRDT